jgi:hypothetical protein
VIINAKECGMKYRVSYLMVPKSLIDGDFKASASRAYNAASTGFSSNGMAAAVSWAASLGLYERVVNLEADSLESVFRLCNSVDAYWVDAMPESANAVFLKKGLRSMSVGDLVDDGAGNYWVCAMFGFEPVSIEGVKS